MSISTFTFQVELQQNYVTKTRRKIVLGRTEYESDEHVLLKFMAWCLFWHPRLAIEKKAVDERYEPDLVLENLDGTVRAWIECGRLSIQKLDKLTRRHPDARIYVLLPRPKDARLMIRQVQKKVDRSSHIRLVAFSQDVAAVLLPALTDKNEVWCNVSWPEAVEDPVEQNAVDLEITINNAYYHAPLSVTVLED